MESFYSLIPEAPREDLLRSYRAFLGERNGTTDARIPFPRREAWMAQSETWSVRHRGQLVAESFERLYARYDPRAELSAPLLALLTFVKVNAAEAYGVEVVTPTRLKKQLASGLFGEVELLVAKEETYHTRILLGAARQFGLEPPKVPYRPPLPLKLLIGSLAHSPEAVFHPILLGAELSGVFQFDWLLRKVGEVFKSEPELRETLEQRLVEILIDELGHVAFNRLAVGGRGLRAAREMAPRIANQTARMTPEFLALGWGRATLDEFPRFDLGGLPDEVRRRGYFV